MGQADRVGPTEEVQRPRLADKEFRPDIEGLRAIAVVAVVFFHAKLPGVGGGFVGVDVFFVISGFLITGLLWREVSTAGTVRLRRFYGARARRLLPASATVGVITAIGAAVLLPPLQARSVMGDGIASAIPAAIKPYSIAVAPVSSAINFFSTLVITITSSFQSWAIAGSFVRLFANSMPSRW